MCTRRQILRHCSLLAQQGHAGSVGFGNGGCHESIDSFPGRQQHHASFAQGFAAQAGQVVGNDLVEHGSKFSNVFVFVVKNRSVHEFQCIERTFVIQEKSSVNSTFSVLGRSAGLGIGVWGGV